MPEVELQYEAAPLIPLKKDIKRTTNYLVGGLLLYELIMFVMMFIEIIVRVVLILMANRNPADFNAKLTTLTDSLTTSGISYLFTIMLGIPLLFLFYSIIQLNHIKPLFVSRRKMNPASFLMILIVFMSCQVIFSIVGMSFEAILNQFHLSILSSMENASADSSTISMLLYASFFGPIAEELIFRGFILRGLARYGKLFAIITSAIIFGAYHGNLIQGIFATFLGCILGYVAMEYSIKWAILLHIINNFVFGDLLNFLMKGLSDNLQTLLLEIMEVGFFIGSIIVILAYRKKILGFIRSEKTEKGFYRFAFSSGWMIVYLILQLIFGISGIEKI